MNGQSAGATSSNTPRWQARMAAMSLALLSVVVIFPLALTVLALWGGVLGIASAWSLNAVGAGQEHVLKESVAVAVALLGSAGGIAAVGATASGITKLDRWQKSRKATQPRFVVSPPNTKKSWWSTLLEHPWLSLGGIALFVDGCVVPFHASRAIHLPPDVLGGFIITGASLLFLFALVLSFRAYVFGMRALWAAVRESAFFAGLVTAGSLVGAGIVLLIGYTMGQAASAASTTETARALEACSGSADCSRRVLQSALDAKPRSLAPVPVAQSTPERPSSFNQCVEEIFRQDTSGNSLRLWGVGEAYRLTWDKDEAEDLVHGVILSVCLISDRLTEVRPYFVRSVQNAAKREWRRSRRYCPIVIEDPTWLPDSCVLQTVEQLYIQAEVGKSTHDALCALSAEEREVIELHMWEGLSHADIARRLRITEQAARKRHSRAMEALKDKFSERCR